MELSDLNTESKEVDHISKRKRYIKECLEKIVYDQLVGIIIEYDYDFSGKLYKIIDTNDQIYSISTLSDYKIVICSHGNIFKILDIDTNEYTPITHKHRGIYRAVTSPNRNIITIPSHIGTIDVYDRNHNCIMQILEKRLIFYINCLSDGRIVTSAATLYKNCVTIWNPNNGKPEIEIETNSLIHCIVELTDQLLVGGDDEGNVKIWNSITGELKRTLIGHTKTVSCIAVHPDGLIVSGSHDSTIIIWDSDGHCVNTLEGHNKKINSVSILPNGMILSQSDNRLKLWNPVEGKCILSLKQNNMTHCIVLKNGLVCVSTDDQILVYH